MLRALFLWWHTWTAYPYLGPGGAAELVHAAIDVETDKVSADLLIAIARVESHHHPDDVSRMTPNGRRTGRWSSTSPGRGWTGPYFCGLIQARAVTWKRCLELRDPRVGLAAGVAELHRWHRYARGDVRRMLAGHGCGIKMSLRCGARVTKDGRRVPPYPARVLSQLRRVHVDGV